MHEYYHMYGIIVHLDRVWIGNRIYSPLFHTPHNYSSQFSVTFTTAYANTSLRLKTNLRRQTSRCELSLIMSQHGPHRKHHSSVV
jgi:hypothetical protein